MGPCTYFSTDNKSLWAGGYTFWGTSVFTIPLEEISGPLGIVGAVLNLLVAIGSEQQGSTVSKLCMRACGVANVSPMLDALPLINKYFHSCKNH